MFENISVHSIFGMAHYVRCLKCGAQNALDHPIFSDTMINTTSMFAGENILFIDFPFQPIEAEWRIYASVN